MSCGNSLNPLKGENLLIKVGNGFSGAVTFTNTGDLVGATAHGLEEGDPIAFDSVVTTTTVLEDTLYYVTNPTANNFQLSSTNPLLPAGPTLVNIDANGTGNAVEAYKDVAGLQDASISLNGEEIDITNKSSGGWKEVLDQAGINSASVSGSGFALDEFSHKKLRSLFMARKIRSYRIYLEGDAGDALPAIGDIYFKGCFKITTLEFSGNYNGAQQISLALASAGVVTVQEI